MSKQLAEEILKKHWDLLPRSMESYTMSWEQLKKYSDVIQSLVAAMKEYASQAATNVAGSDVEALADEFANNSVSKMFKADSHTDAYYDVSINARKQGFVAGYKAASQPTGDQPEFHTEEEVIQFGMHLTGHSQQDIIQMWEGFNNSK